MGVGWRSSIPLRGRRVFVRVGILFKGDHMAMLLLSSVANDSPLGVYLRGETSDPDDAQVLDEFVAFRRGQLEQFERDLAGLEIPVQWMPVRAEDPEVQDRRTARRPADSLDHLARAFSSAPDPTVPAIPATLDTLLGRVDGTLAARAGSSAASGASAQQRRLLQLRKSLAAARERVEG